MHIKQIYNYFQNHFSKLKYKYKHPRNLNFLGKTLTWYFLSYFFTSIYNMIKIFQQTMKIFVLPSPFLVTPLRCLFALFSCFLKNF